MSDRASASGKTSVPLSLLRWKGIGESETKAARIAGIVMLTIMSVAMVATQLNYAVVGDAHMIIALAPIALCALVHGTIPALMMGAITGLAELIHATWLPLDYYEKYFMAPTNSVVLFALTGLLMGLLLSLWDRKTRGASGWLRVVGLLACCAVGSAFFTVFFHQSAYLINSALNLELPSNLLKQLTGSHEVFSQWLANFGLMSIFTVLTERLLVARQPLSSERTIRETFQGWLAIVVFVAYMVSAALGYTAISATCLYEADNDMVGRLEFLGTQLAERDKILDGVARRVNVAPGVLEEVHDSSVTSVAATDEFGRDNLSIIAEDGMIVSSSNASYLGQSFESVVGAGFRDGFDEKLYEDTHAREWAMNGEELSYARASELSYMRLSRSGKYQLMVAIPAHEVFRYRTVSMLGLSLAFLSVFIAVYIQASRLLENVVVRGFEQTNETLSLITKGDLSQEVNVHGTVEFTHLSGGINATVHALRDSIAEAEMQISRELKTAKAIQASALPQTFPPFPEINRFDIYASMNPAWDVGGDFYDFFLIDDHRMGFLIADVSGKGIPAALFMMAAKTEIGNYMMSGIDLAQAIQSANYHLCQSNDTGMFVTVWAAVLDYDSGDLTFVNAGHNPPALRHEGSWKLLDQRGGIILGSFDIAKYRSHTITLTPGDQLVLYTDGVTEAFSATDELYGEERLMAFLESHAREHPHAIVDSLRSDVSRWASGTEQSDDITILSLEYGVAPEVSGAITVPATIENLDGVMSLIHAELARRLCPISVQHQIDVALEELFVNVCRYAYAKDAEVGNVRVDYVYNASPNSLTVQLTDQGVPFDPVAATAPRRAFSIEDAQIGGLGIFMVKKSVDDLSYMRDGDSNIVAFKKTW